MEILDGDAAGLAECRDLIVRNPNPRHLREYQAITGRAGDIAKLVDDDIAVSALVAYARNGETAFVCGVSFFGIDSLPVWMTSTAGAEQLPRWLWRNAKRCIELFDRRVGIGTTYWQWIPDFYREGMNFVRHLGFKTVMTRPSPATGRTLHLVERAVPAWDS